MWLGKNRLWNLSAQLGSWHLSVASQELWQQYLDTKIILPARKSWWKGKCHWLLFSGIRISMVNYLNLGCVRTDKWLIALSGILPKSHHFTSSVDRTYAASFKERIDLFKKKKKKVNLRTWKHILSLIHTKHHHNTKWARLEPDLHNGW